MAAVRSKSVNLCALRVTRLNPVTGLLAPGPKNSYVTSQLISLGFDPQISEGEDREQRGACDCLAVAMKAEDILKRFNLELNLVFREPGLEEMLTGGALITDTGTPGNPIGVNWPLPLDCGELGPAVAIEAWTKAWSGRQQNSLHPWVRWFWPYTKWRPAGGTLEAGFQDPSFVGFTQENDAFDLDTVYGDVPAGAVLLAGGGWFHDSALPTESSPEYATASSA